MDENHIKLLPPAKPSLTVSFYKDSPQQLAQKHEIVKTLLTIRPNPRQGSFTVPMAAMCNLLGQPPYKIVRSLQVGATQALLVTICIYSIAGIMGP